MLVVNWSGQDTNEVMDDWSSLEISPQGKGVQTKENLSWCDSGGQNDEWRRSQVIKIPITLCQNGQIIRPNSWTLPSYFQ